MIFFVCLGIGFKSLIVRSDNLIKNKEVLERSDNLIKNKELLGMQTYNVNSLKKHNFNHQKYMLYVTLFLKWDKNNY